MPGALDWLGDQIGSLFGRQPGLERDARQTIAGNPGVFGMPQSPADSSSLQGLLDPRGAREQAFYSALGQLGAGLLASGQRRPATQPSPLPQAFASFGPAYQGALSSNLQSMRAEQQMAQQQQQMRTQQEQEQAWQSALAAASPAERALMQQMGREQWGQMQGNVEAARRRPTSVSPGGQLVDPSSGRVIASVPDRPHPMQIGGSAETGYFLYNPNAPSGGSALPPGGVPPGQSATSGDTRVPVGIRNNNWLSMSPGGRVAQYETPEVGIAAASQNLDRLFPSGTVTPRQLVQTWAQGPNYDPARVTPGIRASVENYGTAVARAAGVSNPDQPINLRDPATRLRVMHAMGQFETRGLPQGAEAVLARGVALAAQPRYMPRQGTQAGGAMPGQAAPDPAEAGPAMAEARPSTLDPTQQSYFDRGRQAPPAAAPQQPTAPATPGLPPGVTPLTQPRPRPVGELVQVQGPNGPVLVPREVAVGMTPARPTEPLTTIMTPKGPIHVPREQAIGQPAVPSAGMSVTTTDANGNPVTVQVGGTPGQPGGQTAATARALEEQITANTARLDRLNAIAGRMRPEFLQLGGQADAWTLSTLERFGRTLTPDQQRRVSEYTTFRSDAFRELNETIREMSGTAVSASEGTRVLAAAPNVDSDSPTQFQAKLQATIQSVRLANARLHWYRANGIQPSFRGGDSGPVPLSNMPGVIAAREDALVAELTRQMVPEAQIRDRVRRQLIQEFGLD